ncbi:thioesterase [Paenimyroides tangerinum]|uniref:Thioesterase n=1 Tax=Paenimyroides tangerinum TaxID=2488728 RepID=A0A3P3W7B5_9FLAO|nr:thioesterase family protein [Paenimyroides tangerinum]RRJ90328.1 thioesterase [Paenimyroides tangerinum]
MENIYYKGQVLWSQIDANGHLRHSAYSDLCTQARSNMMKQVGFSMQEFAKHKIGPILFKEETIYFKEVRMDEEVYVKVLMTKFNDENHRFSITHELYNSKDVKCAVVNVDGAWMNLAERKLTLIPNELVGLIEFIPKSENFNAE